MVALHARRSADSVRDFAEKAPGRGVAVVLTGTDLYRDLPASQEAAPVETATAAKTAAGRRHFGHQHRDRCSREQRDRHLA